MPCCCFLDLTTIGCKQTSDQKLRTLYHCLFDLFEYYNHFYSYFIKCVTLSQLTYTALLVIKYPPTVQKEKEKKWGGGGGGGEEEEEEEALNIIKANITKQQKVNQNKITFFSLFFHRS